MIAKTLLLAGVAASALSWCATASAAPAQGAGQLEEIVVTARRRAESAQTVPISVSAVSGETIKARHFSTLTDLQSNTPSLRFSSLNVPDTISYAIRGQRTHNPRPNQDQSVALYFNDVAVGPQTGAALGFFDMGSVQVLKGAQGTLFGRNTTGGAILVSPVKPGDRLEGYAEISGGSYGRIAGEGAATIPVSDALSLRLSGRITRRDGYGHVIGGPLKGRDVGDEKQEDFRLSVVLKPNDRFENYSVFYYDHYHDNGWPGQVTYYNPQSTVRFYTGSPVQLGPVTLNLPNFAGEVAQLNGSRYDSLTNLPTNTRDTVEGFTNTSTVKLGSSPMGDITFKNIVGYRHLSGHHLVDFDQVAADVFQSAQDQHFSTVSEEAQILGSKTGLDWIVGAYYFRMKGTDYSAFNFFGGVSASNPSTTNQDLKNTSKALYAQATVNLGRFSDGLSAVNFTAGARYTWENRWQNLHPIGNSATGFKCLFPAADLAAPYPACTSIFEKDFKKLTWTFSLDYRFDPEKMAYATVRRGFRSGGFNNGSVSRAGNPPFLPESVTDYELGLKADWRLGEMPVRTNVALYQSDYRNIQRQNSFFLPNANGVGGLVVAVIDNASRAKIRGLEFEGTARPTSWLELSGFYTYSDAKYKKYLYSTGTAVIDLSANEFAYTPKHSASATARVIIPMDESMGSLSVSGTYSYQSSFQVDDRVQKTYLTFIGHPEWAPLYVQKAYGLVDMSLNWRNAMGRGLDLSVFVRNLADKKYLAGSVMILDSAGVNFGSYGPPRTVGASLTYRFGG